MLRIKDYIFNENEIIYIWESDEEELYVQLKTDEDNPSNCKKFRNATFEDIEWDYVGYINKNLSSAKKYLEETNKRIEELEEENKKLKEENQHIFANVNDDELLRSNVMNWAEKNELQQRINKAIEYLRDNREYQEDLCDDLLKILKGE